MLSEFWTRCGCSRWSSRWSSQRCCEQTLALPRRLLGFLVDDFTAAAARDIGCVLAEVARWGHYQRADLQERKLIVPYIGGVGSRITVGRTTAAEQSVSNFDTACLLVLHYSQYFSINCLH